jgi:hypothetical protein
MEVEDTDLTERAIRLLDPDTVAKDVRYRCGCECSMRWTCHDLGNARYSYLVLSLRDQLWRVYDIIVAHRDQNTKEITLTIGGNFFKFRKKILRF